MCRYYGFFLVEKKPTALFVFLYICGYMAHIALLTYTYKWSNMKDIDKKWLEKWETVKEKTEVVWTFMKFKICLNFWGVFGPWRRSVASYTTDERLKNGQKERWRLNLEEINLQIKSSSEKFRRLHCLPCWPQRLFWARYYSRDVAGKNEYRHLRFAQWRCIGSRSIGLSCR